MEKVCLDYEAALDFLRGEYNTMKKIKYYVDREEICITSLCLLQLATVIRKPAVVHAFSNSATVLPFDKKAAEVANRISVDFKERGNARPSIETLITSSTCIANNALLFTRNPSYFDGIRELKKV